jgi:hypothetical protein
MGSIFDEFERKEKINIGSRPMTSKPGGKLLSSTARNIQSQQQLLRKKVKYYQNQTHYDWNTGP